MNDLVPLLALLHPRGEVARVACIVPGGAAHEGAVDLALAAAPAARTVGRAAAAAAAAVGREGLAVVVTTGRAAPLARRALAGQGLHVEAVFGVRRSHGQALVLVSLEPCAVAHAALTYGGVPPSLAWIVPRLLRRRTVGMLAAGLPRVAVVARPATAAPALAWTGTADEAACGRALVLGSWRGPRGSAVIDLASVGARARLIAKLPPAADTEAAGTEADALRSLGPGAEQAGALVPQVLRLVSAGARTAIVERPVPGTQASRLLHRRPARLAPFLGAVGTWLERWNVSTRTEPRPARGLLDEWLAGRPHVDGDLAARMRARLDAVHLPLVATHGDLTAANVLVDGGGTIGVLDWQTARPRGLPIGDLAYAAVDAVRIAARHWTHLTAYEDCFESSGPHAELVARLHRSLASALGLSPADAWAAAGASWLEHAANEAGSAGAHAPRPFLEIARRATAANVPALLGC